MWRDNLRRAFLPEVVLIAFVTGTHDTWIARLTSLFLAATILSACGSEEVPSRTPASAVAGEAERIGGTAVVGVGLGDVNAPLNPLAPRYLARSVTRDLLFLPLVRYDRHGEVVPALAERWDTTPGQGDTLTLTFYLRSDVRWHDGEPTTAEDVQFTYSRILSPLPAHPSSGCFRRFLSGPERVSQDAVRFRLVPHPGFMKAFTEVAIAPAHLLDRDASEERVLVAFLQRPIGNGPFRFVRQVTYHELVLEANLDFSEGLGGRPYLDRLVFREGSNPYAIQSNLLAGRFHVAQMMRGQVDFPDPPAGFKFVTDPETNIQWIVWSDDSPDPSSAPSRTITGSRLRGVDADGSSMFGGAARWWLTTGTARSP